VNGTPVPATAAFFDVDETLVTCKSMLSFLDHYYRLMGRPDTAAPGEIAALADITARGGTREESNRSYYRLFTGHRTEEVAEAGRSWFADRMEAGGMFHPPVLDALVFHRDAGHLTALVSGSFSACLDPIADHLGADLVLGTVPEVVRGRYTGDVICSRIGAGKAEAAAGVLREGLFSAAEAYAYGDHASDLSLLQQVGHPVVVGDDPVLLEQTRTAFWARLPGINAPFNRI